MEKKSVERPEYNNESYANSFWVECHSDVRQPT